MVRARVSNLPLGNPRLPSRVVRPVGDVDPTGETEPGGIDLVFDLPRQAEPALDHPGATCRVDDPASFDDHAGACTRQRHRMLVVAELDVLYRGTPEHVHSCCLGGVPESV